MRVFIAGIDGYLGIWESKLLLNGELFSNGYNVFHLCWKCDFYVSFSCMVIFFYSIEGNSIHFIHVSSFDPDILNNFAIPCKLSKKFFLSS